MLHGLVPPFSATQGPGTAKKRVWVTRPRTKVHETSPLARPERSNI